MIHINLNKVPYKVKDKVIYVSEVNVAFATRYMVTSDKTGKSKLFEFEYSTGSEFDPKTEWIYKSNDGIKLHVCNDTEMTKRNAQNYLTAKLR